MWKRILIASLVFVVLATVSVYVTLAEGDSVRGEEVGDRKKMEIDHQTAESDQNQKDPYQNTDGKIVSKKLLQVDSPYSDQVELYRIQYMSEGLHVVGFLCKPKKIEEKLPVIIYNRGGILESSKIEEDHLEYFTKLASRHYVVLASQYRGNDGSEGQKGIAGKDVRDVLNLIPLADSLSYADPDNKVMLGYSRGGMMTYRAIREGVDIRAAAIVGGVSDLKQLYEEKNVFRSPLSKMVGDPLLNEDQYKTRSAVEWPDDLRVPILLVHGLEDPTVNPSQSRRLAERLKQLGYEHRLVLIPGGNHYVTNQPEKRDREIFKWFDQYLE
ncbi:alpha/beta hydrolase family protein [Paludifilum halophilum]|uniref:alpha/beta hydrolase family protein n=1 Tax=Paludifilum halophilum TaxID=1642702 RepID=UPI00146CD5F7|nr:prolyl oligopeptidase family serine peptidase [Paludifilum halophilum]